MQPLLDLYRDPIVAHAAQWMLTLAIQSSVFLAVILLIERLVAKHVHPAERHRHLLFSLLAIPLLPYASRLLAPLKLSTFSPALPVTSPVDPVTFVHTVQTSTPLYLQLAATPEILRIAPTITEQTVIPWTAWLPLLAVTIYCVGVAFLSVRLLAGMSRVQRVVQRSRPLRDDQWATFETMISIPAQVRILASGELPSPILAGWIRPVIILPIRLFEQGSEQEIRFAIEHELAHYRRHDTRIKLIVAVLKTILWPQPLVWALTQRVSLLAEQACDAEVTRHHSSPLPYAEFLTRMGSQPSYAGAEAALSHHTSQLLPRIQHLLNARRPIMSPKRTTLLLSTVAAVLLLSSALIATPIVDTTNATNIPAEPAEPAPPADLAMPDLPDAQPVEEVPPAEPAPEVLPEPAEPADLFVSIDEMAMDSLDLDSVNVFYTKDGDVIKVMRAVGDNTLLIMSDSGGDTLRGAVFDDMVVTVVDSSGSKVIRAYIEGDSMITGRALRMSVRNERGDSYIQRVEVRPDRSGRVYFIDVDGDTLLYRVREARHFVRHAVK